MAVSQHQHSPTVTVILTRAYCPPWLPVCACQPMLANSNPPVTVILTRTYYLPWLLGCGCQSKSVITTVTVILTRAYCPPWLPVRACQTSLAILPVTVILTRTYCLPRLPGCGCQPTSAVPHSYCHLALRWKGPEAAVRLGSRLRRTEHPDQGGSPLSGRPLCCLGSTI